MKVQSYTFYGEEEYDEKIFPVLDALFSDVMDDPDGYYMIAVNEAVSNAMYYGSHGSDSEKVCIEIRLTESDITTVVMSDSRFFDVMLFRDKMRRLAEDPQVAEMRWGDYTSYMQRSRGYWLMLQPCEYLYLDVSGKRVSLVARLPFSSARASHDKIKYLVPKFLVEKDGVIF